LGRSRSANGYRYLANGSSFAIIAKLTNCLVGFCNSIANLTNSSGGTPSEPGRGPTRLRFRPDCTPTIYPELREISGRIRQAHWPVTVTTKDFARRIGEHLPT